MAPYTVFDSSHTSLVVLQQRFPNRLPAIAEPPKRASDSSAYVNDAISLLGESVRAVDERFDAVDKRFDAVDERLDAMDKRFDGVDKRLDKIEDEILGLRTEFRGFQMNSLRRILEDPIEPIAALVEKDGKKRYEVAPDFPPTIKEFWRLDKKPDVLARLASHYDIPGWQNWNRARSDDTEATTFDDLETAVTQHPDKCLRILALKWGLRFDDLESALPTTPSDNLRPLHPFSHYSPPRRRPILPIPPALSKRKAPPDSRPDEKRARIEQEEVHLALSPDREGNWFVQETQIQRGPRVPFNPAMLSSPKIGWRVGSTPSDERWAVGDGGLRKYEKIQLYRHRTSEGMEEEHGKANSDGE